MRRLAATLLVVASPAVLAAPVGAGSAPIPAVAAPLAPTVAPPAVAVAPVAVPRVAPPAVRIAPVAAVTPPVHRVVKARVVAGRARAAVDDALYAERLQADLCLARAIFCGVDHTGHYRAG